MRLESILFVTKSSFEIIMITAPHVISETWERVSNLVHLLRGQALRSKTRKIKFQRIKKHNFGMQPKITVISLDFSNDFLDRGGNILISGVFFLYGIPLTDK